VPPQKLYDENCMAGCMDVCLSFIAMLYESYEQTLHVPRSREEIKRVEPP